MVTEEKFNEAIELIEKLNDEKTVMLHSLNTQTKINVDLRNCFNCALRTPCGISGDILSQGSCHSWVMEFVK